MKHFDQVFAREIASRLEALPPDAKPQWGAMTRGQLIGHLAQILHYTLGKGPDLPFKGNFRSRTVFKFLILSGIRAIPHNVRLPRPKEVPKEEWFTEAPLDTLREAMDAYLAAAEAGNLPTRVHPFFGRLNAREWRRLHRVHYIHHMKQFGIGHGL